MWLIYNWNNHSHYKPVLIGPSFSLCFNSKNRAKKLLRLNEKSPKSNYLQGEVPGRHPPCTFETLDFQTKKHSWRSGGMSEFDRIMALNLLLSKTPPRSSLGGSQSPNTTHWTKHSTISSTSQPNIHRLSPGTWPPSPGGCIFVVVPPNTPRKVSPRGFCLGGSITHLLTCSKRKYLTFTLRCLFFSPGST